MAAGPRVSWATRFSLFGAMVLAAWPTLTVETATCCQGAAWVLVACGCGGPGSL